MRASLTEEESGVLSLESGVSESTRQRQFLLLTSDSRLKTLTIWFTNVVSSTENVTARVTNFVASGEGSALAFQEYEGLS